MSKPNVKHYRTSQLAQIHIAKKELGMDDDTYRAMLWTCARVESSADLDYAGRLKVLEHLKARGWKNKQIKPPVIEHKQAQINKIEALIADMQLSWAYADGLAKRMYKRDKVQWCDAKELQGIIAALVNKQKGQHASAS